MYMLVTKNIEIIMLSRVGFLICDLRTMNEGPFNFVFHQMSHVYCLTRTVLHRMPADENTLLDVIYVTKKIMT